MIHFASGILGAAAATLAFGAVHLEVESGNDLLGPRHLISATTSDSVAAPADKVNRTDKGDRLDISIVGETAGNLTIGFRVPGITDSSVLMRVPMREAAKSTTPPRSGNASAPRRAIACEPSVSVLTPIAKELAPARCIT